MYHWATVLNISAASGALGFPATVQFGYADNARSWRFSISPAQTNNSSQLSGSGLLDLPLDRSFPWTLPKNGHES
jgi:hypothetical protein